MDNDTNRNRKTYIKASRIKSKEHFAFWERVDAFQWVLQALQIVEKYIYD